MAALSQKEQNVSSGKYRRQQNETKGDDSKNSFPVSFAKSGGTNSCTGSGLYLHQFYPSAEGRCCDEDTHRFKFPGRDHRRGCRELVPRISGRKSNFATEKIRRGYLSERGRRRERVEGVA